MRTPVASLILVLFVLNVQAESEDGHEPMVAFHCNQPAMYSTDNGWVKDDSSGCLKDPADILSYCRKVFPSLDVRNVVEASEKVTIPNWCDFGSTMCNQQFSVLPFRCLVGPFQSDALLVPEHCIFDHIHDSKICTSYNEWNKTSFRSCHDRDMIQQSFAMLQPCGIDKFSGVEFVCCPSEDGEKKLSLETVNTKRPAPLAVSTITPMRNGKSRSTKNDDFNEYVNQPAASAAGRKWNEHEYYVKAKNDMRKHHHDKVAKMMKDWTSARQRVQDLKAVDPKASEKLNKEVTSRFQKTYEAEEVESELEKKQLAALHQQRVQAELNDKKRRALDNFMETIDDFDTDSTEILKALKHYIKALQKDRIHTVNHFKHLLETDPAEADTSRFQMAEHLRGIDQQLNQALDMLDRVPKYKNKVKKQIEDYLDSYHSIDASISVLLLNPERSTTSPTTSATAVPKHKVVEDVSEDDYEGEESYENEAKDESEAVQETEDATRKPDEEDYQEEEYEEVDEDEENNDEEDETNINQQSTVAEPSASTAPASTPSTGFPDEVEADEDDMDEQIHIKHDDHIANNMDKSYLHIMKEPYIQKAPVKGVSGFNAAVPLGIAVGGITVFVVIIVGVVVMRRRARQRRPRSLGSLDLDPAASPEERHVASMQMNGYENPTYKYFEMNSNA